MAKEPVLGAVKTRLARGSTGTEAVRAYRTMLRQTVRRLGRDPRWRLVLAIAPGTALMSGALPGVTVRIAQEAGDLGARMQRALDTLRAQGPVVLIGSDIPNIVTRDIADAFHALASHDAVIGPSDDGGYWLIGLGRRRHMAPFGQVRWSGPFALPDTISGLSGARIAQLRNLSDVDTAADWRAWTAQPPSARFRGC
jgi:uncharacterized protein